MKAPMTVIILFFSLLLNGPLRAQNFDWYGGLTAEYYQLGRRQQTAYGLHFEIEAPHRITFNYRANIGPRIGGGLYLHLPASAGIAAWLLSKSAGDGTTAGIAVLALAIPEGVGYYFDPGYHMHLSVNPLGVDYWFRKNPYEEVTKFGLSVTARFNLYTGSKVDFPAFIAPFVSGTMMYRPGTEFSRYGIHAGIMIGFEPDGSGHSHTPLFAPKD